ncbi:universal stress protein [Roseicyclus persicicus]|uniref:Universal stress protein n=1 Tax=Roseicyclus persicicus TaxID=2650661 RepID=A0A7X6JZI4_9RHOB|nr:universal stress protein [Roseibacterium persicicum]NKX44848.1 universal stress protein [Roseibacterium persicicum]
MTDAKLRTIMVATDLSERSDRALDRAVMLARAHDARLSVVSAVDGAYPPALRDEFTARVRQHLDHARPGDDVVTTIHVEAGDVVEILLRHLNGPEVDLAVLGVHRTRTFLDGLRQTTMERLVQGVRKPVLLVRDLATGPYARALVPVSFSPSCAAALAAVAQIAPGASCRAVHAWLVPFGGLTGGAGSEMAPAVEAETRALAEDWAARLPAGLPRPVLVHGGVVEVLERELATVAPDLVAIGAHTRPGPALHPLGGFAAELIRRPPCDLLVTRGR